MPVDDQLPLLRDPLQRLAFQDAGVTPLRDNRAACGEHEEPAAGTHFDLRLLQQKLTTQVGAIHLENARTASRGESPSRSPAGQLALVGTRAAG